MADHGPVPLRLVPLPPGVPEGIQVWHLPLCLERPAPDRDWALLSPAEVERAERLRQPADRVRSVCTRAALRRLLGERLGMAASQVPLGTGPHGRPRLEADSEVGGQGQETGSGSARCRTEGPLPDFNVSHSGACALIAVAENGLSVGVDVEWCGATPTAVSTPAYTYVPGQGFAISAEEEARALEALVLSPREQAACASTRPGFHALWTTKEAVLKCLGLGVAEHLCAVSLQWQAEGPRGRPCSSIGNAHGASGSVAVWLEGPLQGLNVQACQLPLAAGHAAALAWSSDPGSLRCAGTEAGTPLAPPTTGALDLHRALPPS